MHCTTDDIKRLGTILGIWAHPDDESFCMAGILACAARNGQRTACITATKGDAGQSADEQKWPKARLAEIRTAEMAATMQILKVAKHYWLDYKDGELARSDSTKAISEIAAIIQQEQPDSIFTFCSDGITGHEDHRTIHIWTKRAIEKAGSSAALYCAVEIAERYNSEINQRSDEAFNIYFNIDKPRLVAKDDLDIYFELPPDVHQKKLDALRAQESQTAGMFASELGRQYVEEITKCEGFMKETL